MFKTRLISGIVLVLAMIILFVIGGPILWAGMAAISTIGLYEFYKAVRVNDKIPMIMGYVALACLYVFLLIKGGDRAIAASGAIMIVLLLGTMVFTYPRYQLTQIAVVGFGFFYVPVLLSYIYLTRCLPHGKSLVWLIILSAWGSDTLAYCTGMLAGRHKMTPQLSPKKTIEGAVGGVVGAALLGLIYGLILHAAAPASGANGGWFALICGLGGAISMIGDLAASAIKRNYEIKDYGHLIPGHGGILDRFDSVIITAPVIYFLSVVLL